MEFSDFYALIRGMVEDALADERARIRREEVEPLREALFRLIEHLDTGDSSWLSDCCVGCGSRTFEHRPRCTYEAAEAALRAADERGK